MGKVCSYPQRCAIMHGILKADTTRSKPQGSLAILSVLVRVPIAGKH